MKHSWFRSRWIRSLIGALAAAAALAVGIVAAQDGASLTEDQLRNLEYPNDFTTGGTAPLTDGAYTEPIQPGAATQTEVRFDRAAFGSIDGQPAAAVILGTDPEGTGFFVNLHLVDADLVPLVTTLLGDRVRIQALQIISDRIVVDFLGFAPTDPLCCRTQNVSQAYALQAGALRLVSAVSLPALIDVPEGLSLIGWYGANPPPPPPSSPRRRSCSASGGSIPPPTAGSWTTGTFRWRSAPPSRSRAAPASSSSPRTPLQSPCR